MATYETRAVLAASYKGAAGLTAALTHTVALIRGEPVKVLCEGVKLTSLADPEATKTDGKPSCMICARRDPRFVWKLDNYNDGTI